MATEQAFFQGLKVVELASVLAGPAVGRFFAELGATVIKVENGATGGDVTRRWKVPEEDPNQADSAYYHSVNWGKETHLLDLAQEANRAQVAQWIAEADVLISNFRAGSAQRLGFDYASLAAKHPQLIFGEISGYGPGDDRPAFDVILQAEAGFLYMTGHPGAPPAKLPVALIDLLAAHQLKEGILVALLARARTGLGSRVQVSLYDAALASLANQATNWLIAGHVPQRLGARHPNIAPYGDLFTTADGHEVVLAVGAEAQFVGLCAAVGMPELAGDERFCTNALRVVNREALLALLTPAIGRLTRDALLQACEAQGAPAGAVLTLPEVFSRPAAQQLLQSQSNAAGQQVLSVRTAVFQLTTNPH